MLRTKASSRSYVIQYENDTCDWTKFCLTASGVRCEFSFTSGIPGRLRLVSARSVAAAVAAASRYGP
jgi:hypothetical protein